MTRNKKDKIMQRDGRYNENQQNFIRQRITTLPFLEQRIIRLMYWEGLTAREIAFNLGKKVSFVKAIEKRALKTLKRIYFREYGPLRLWKELYARCNKDERDYLRRLLGA